MRLANKQGGRRSKRLYINLSLVPKLHLGMHLSRQLHCLGLDGFRAARDVAS